MDQGSEPIWSAGRAADQNGTGRVDIPGSAWTIRARMVGKAVGCPLAVVTTVPAPAAVDGNGWLSSSGGPAGRTHVDGLL
jgi:hypothetical protein